MVRRPFGVREDDISDIERGVRNPGLLVMVGLALALRVSLRELVEEIEPRSR